MNDDWDGDIDRNGDTNWTGIEDCDRDSDDAADCGEEDEDGHGADAAPDSIYKVWRLRRARAARDKRDPGTNADDGADCEGRSATARLREELLFTVRSRE